ncbi:LysR substrate-binding domain-containing protein [Cocleimonas sp. KMM 6892]|uniref:LysR substrate-binding domain-containing protein n=1 Tax=unclassified Cocleimonas TaxID=2639732 RepID=UPI002DBD7ED0|nr:MULTISPECIES: LysR substrate-binding domain-containing protein [unclassified Cocleimonas]MEB8430623.1 LysR substrate-binding domain-containing protein [Cocleimonas sp. KMM 6892]MEC4716926.1 LysR substrate-binding domain-containing protein [Cocleimonas sp. KMM 6895]MEC4743938.1 LysR substrate-binding domain-containing protein [Cocleimonas sp. KMM 6896]
MLKNIGSLNSLRVFEVAGRKMSFTKAAEELHLSQGAVSYQIRELESRLGLKLFKREIRKVSLTDAGERLYKVTRRALIDIDSEIEALTSNKNSATLTVAASTYVTTRWLSKRLTSFINAHPDTALQLQHSVNTPDFKVGMYDLAIRWGKSPWPGAVSRELLPMPMLPVCSPDLLQGDKSITRNPKNLRFCTLLRDQENVDLWPEWLDKAGVPQASISASRVIADPVVRTQAALDGQGVMLADGLVDAELASGELVAPFDISLEGYGYHILWDQNEELNEITVNFLDWIMTQT